MSRGDAIRQKQMEIDEVERDMRGINPVLNLYRVLADRLAKLEAELKELSDEG